MTLHVMDNDDVCVNMGEPEFDPQKSLSVHKKWKRPILSGQWNGLFYAV